MYKRVKELRIEGGYSQEIIAQMLSVSQATYSRYENGNLDIPSVLLIRLALFYETSIDFLLGLTDMREAYRKTTGI